MKLSQRLFELMPEVIQRDIKNGLGYPMTVFFASVLISAGCLVSIIIALGLGAIATIIVTMMSAG